MKRSRVGRLSSLNGRLLLAVRKSVVDGGVCDADDRFGLAQGVVCVTTRCLRAMDMYVPSTWYFFLRVNQNCPRLSCAISDVHTSRPSRKAHVPSAAGEPRPPLARTSQGKDKPKEALKL